MIKTLIFDFGDVFINLDKKGAWNHALELFNITEFTPDMLKINLEFEQGLIDTSSFMGFYMGKFPNLDETQILYAWNYIIKDFPRYRLEWLEHLKNNSDFECILLSNTNTLHIDYIKEKVDFYEEFKDCFNAFYLSHEIGYRKPNLDIYEFVLDQHNLTPHECLFIDDTKANTDAASTLGINTWNIDETKQDVINLFEIKKNLFQ